MLIHCMIIHCLLEAEDFWDFPTSQSHSDRWMSEAEEVSAIFRGVASQRGSVATYVGAVEGTTSWARGDTLNTLKSVSTTI